MNLNNTIKTQLNHRSIRHFKNQPLDKETLNTLYEVANHTASSQFLQQFSIIHVTDKNKRTKLAENGFVPSRLIWCYFSCSKHVPCSWKFSLGGVILGSIRNDIRAVSELFNLPDMVIPALGLQIGIPDEEIQQKPRLPLSFKVFENEYQDNLSTQDYEDYDKEVEHYYLSRTSNPRKENFTQQIIGKNSNLNRKVTKRDEVLELTHSKGMLWN